MHEIQDGSHSAVSTRVYDLIVMRPIGGPRMNFLMNVYISILVWSLAVFEMLHVIIRDLRELGLSFCGIVKIFYFSLFLV